MGLENVMTLVDNADEIDEGRVSGSFVPPEGEKECPPAPESLDDAGISISAATDLILKTLYSRGAQQGRTIAEILALRFTLLDDLLLRLQQMELVEVRGSQGHGREGYVFALTRAGIERAREAMEINGYVGPAPVPFDVFQEWVARQSAKGLRITPQDLAEALSDLVLRPDVIEMLGPAVNSFSSLFLHGAPGNGKTAIAERIARLASDSVYIPYAVEIGGEIMVLFDPVYHERVEDNREDPPHVILRNPALHDLRFVEIRRPAVTVGGELTLDQLDMQRDAETKVYHAPFQLKAVHGVLVIDDFGRQRVQPHELLNRWIVPLEKKIDYLSLNTGIKFSAPFDCLPIFSTNLDPLDLVDEAFLRRIRFKIEVVGPTRQVYEDIMRDECERRGIQFDHDTVRFLWDKYHVEVGVEPRCCHPRDVLDQIEAAAAFAGKEPELTRRAVDLAAKSHFMITAREQAERARVEKES
ncbi:MAG: ATP-binding protein [Gemmatimonadetes bacterium]|nr:ATP-binding protein [Gemmatimonadota bacterium]